MISHAKWKTTSEHKASEYFCSKCCNQCHSPQEVYSHLEKGCAAALRLSKPVNKRVHRITHVEDSQREKRLEKPGAFKVASVCRASEGASTYVDKSGRPTPKQKAALSRDEGYTFNPAFKNLSMVEQRALCLWMPPPYPAERSKTQLSQNRTAEQRSLGPWYDGRSS